MTPTSLSPDGFSGWHCVSSCPCMFRTSSAELLLPTGTTPLTSLLPAGLHEQTFPLESQEPLWVCVTGLRSPTRSTEAAPKFIYPLLLGGPPDLLTNTLTALGFSCSSHLESFLLCMQPHHFPRVEGLLGHGVSHIKSKAIWDTGGLPLSPHVCMSAPHLLTLGNLPCIP